MVGISRLLCASFTSLAFFCVFLRVFIGCFKELKLW